MKSGGYMYPVYPVVATPLTLIVQLMYTFSNECSQRSRVGLSEEMVFSPSPKYPRLCLTDADGLALQYSTQVDV